MPGKKIKILPSQKVGAAGCDGGLGRKGERAHPTSRFPARRGHNRKGKLESGSDGKPTGTLGKWGGYGGVTDVPSGTDRGCLRSGGKPSGLLRQKAVVVLVSQACSSRDGWGIRDRWVGEELFGVRWQRKNQRAVEKRRKRTAKNNNNNPPGNSTSWWRTKVGMRKAV